MVYFISVIGRFSGLILLGFSALLLTACGGGGASVTPAPAPVTGLPLVENIGAFEGSYLHQPFVAGDKIYVPTGIDGEGVVVLDVTDISAPVIESTIVVGTLTDAQPRDLAVDGEILYTVNGAEIHSVDIGNNNAVLDSLIGVAGSAASIKLVGNVAYVTGIGSEPALRTIDISDPSNILDLDASPILEGHNVAIDGGHAYVAAGTKGLCIFDVTDPGNITGKDGVSVPSVVNDCIDVDGVVLNSLATKVSIVDGLALVMSTGDDYSIRPVDISDPENPVLLVGKAITYSSVPEAYDYLGMAVSGDNVYLGTLVGAQVLDISNRAAPTLNPKSGPIYSSSLITGLAVKDDRLIVATPANLYIVDVSALQ